MGFTVTVPATSTDLTTLDRVKGELGITNGDHDKVLHDLIADASAAITAHCFGGVPQGTDGKPGSFGRQTYVELTPAHGDNILMLTFCPIIGTPTVVWADDPTTPLVDFTVDDPMAGILYRRIGWSNTSAVGWRLTPFFRPNSSEPSYQVSYVAGWILPRDASPTLPRDIERACVETAKAWFLGRNLNPNVTSKRVGDLWLTFNKANAFGINGDALPLNAIGLLDPYTRVALGRM